MKKFFKSAFLSVAILVAPSVVILTPTPAKAESLRYMSCSQLWYERNAIFAREGYCFSSRRAIRAFGRRCYSPYGRLSRYEKSRVDDIKYWERVNGCR